MCSIMPLAPSKWGGSHWLPGLVSLSARPLLAGGSAGVPELKLMLEAIEKLPNPLVQGGADLAEAVAEGNRVGHFVTETVE